MGRADRRVASRATHVDLRVDEARSGTAVADSGGRLRIPTTALRFFNIYGPGQSLHNPYAGVASIFAARLLAGGAPELFEDGGQRRDFVHVKDVARACRLAVEQLSSGDCRPRVADSHSTLAADDQYRSRTGRTLGDGVWPSGFGTGADRTLPSGGHPALLRRHIGCRSGAGFEARVEMRDGLEELARSIRSGETGSLDDRAVRELRDRGLVT